MRRRLGSFLIALGLLLMAGAAGLVIYNRGDNRRAGEASAEICKELEQVMQEEGEPARPALPGIRRRRGQELDSRVKAELTEAEEMPTVEIDSWRYIGVLEIPDLGLRLPVMEGWSYEALRVSPCRYTGSYFTDDMVLCAHNYDRHFGGLLGIEPGTDVYFITVKQVIYHYTVSHRETLQPDAVSLMSDNLNNSPEINGTGDWDLTLFTCHIGGQSRCTVRCIRAD